MGIRLRGGSATPPYVLPPNLIGYWHFNDNLTDATINANTLTATGTPAYVAGELNDCIDLTDNTCDYLGTLPDIMKFAYDSNFTFECWFKATDGFHYQQIMNISATTNSFIKIGYHGDGDQITDFYARMKDSDNIESTITLSSASMMDGNWHHVALTCQAYPQDLPPYNHLILYLDGVSVGTADPNFTGNFYNGHSRLVLGQEWLYDDMFPAFGNALTGCIDDARVWNIVRSAAEILANKDTETPV